MLNKINLLGPYWGVRSSQVPKIERTLFARNPDEAKEIILRERTLFFYRQLKRAKTILLGIALTGIGFAIFTKLKDKDKPISK